MNPSDLFDSSVKYGLGIVLSLGAVYALWHITRYTLTESTKREGRLADVIDRNLVETKNLLMAHDQRAIDAIKGMQEAAQYQRTEHVKMIEILTELVLTVRKLNGKMP